MDSASIHFHALCNAVEHERLEKCRAILESSKVHERELDLGNTNADGFTPLDLAFMTGKREIIDLILDHGGTEGGAFANPIAVSAHLQSLAAESKKQVEKFGQLTSGVGHAHAQLSHAQLKECEKQRTLWQKRMATLKRLKQGFEAGGCPHAPDRVEVSVTGPTEVSVRLWEPEMVGHGPYTRYKVQWCHTDSFAKIEDEIVVTEDVTRLTYNVSGLTEGKRYFIRASFGNMKGFGPFSASTPKSVVPSSWRSVEDRVPRIRDQLDVCRGTFETLGGGGINATGHEDESGESHQGFLKKRKGGLVRHFFSTSSAPKLQRHLHPNRIYLACIFFHEDKVLMTNEEALPVMEVVDGAEYPPSVVGEHQWFASKLCNAWKDAERLKHEATKLNNSPAGPTGFRVKLINAAVNMQHALGVTDLGSAYHRPYRHQSDGSVVFTTACHVKQPKSLVSLSLKWVPLSKAQRRSAFETDHEVNSMDALRYGLREQILHQQVSEIRLSSGLYLCYLQAESSIDSLRVIVSNTSPSVLPYSRVRENCHVTCDEWDWITKMGALSSHASSMQAPSPTTNFLFGEGEEGSDVATTHHTAALRQLKPTESQYAFGKQLQYAMERLFDYLEIPLVDRKKHRLYDAEVLEISNDVRAIIVLPPVDTVCSVADRAPSLNLKRNDLLPLPVQIFETLHLAAYHVEMLQSYSRTALLLEFQLVVARQQQREAFSNQEVDAAQNQLSLLTDLQQVIEDSWKTTRWMLDTISAARNKNANCGLSYEHLVEWYCSRTDVPDDAARLFDESSCSGGSLQYQRSPQRHSTAGVTTHKDMVGAGPSRGIHRTPTTRSDPLEFNTSQNDNKENEVRNFPKVSTGAVVSSSSTPSQSGSYHNQQQQQQATSAHSSLTFYSQQSTNSSLSSNEAAAATGNNRLYENDPPQPAGTSSSSRKSSYDPHVAQSGRFSKDNGGESPEPNILQVFAAYDTGLASGTSVKLNVTHSTSTREVIDLVIKQLNMAVILKGRDGPIYENDKLKNFCLVAVIGNRERCLRDDFKPLNLQNPWKKGKLLVRMKNDLLAAIDHISRHSTML